MNDKKIPDENIPKEIGEHTLPEHYPYAAPESPAPDTPEDNAPAGRRGCGLWAWIIGILLAVGVFVGAYFFFRWEENSAAREQSKELATEAAIDSVEALPDNAAYNAPESEVEAQSESISEATREAESAPDDASAGAGR